MTSYSDQILTVELNGRVFRINKNQRLNILKSYDNVNEPSTAKKSVDVSIPKVSFKVLHSSKKTDFKLPTEYIRYNGCEAEIEEDRVEYDIDKEDMVWLKLANERRKRSGIKQLQEDVFELAIDRLEKESHFQIAAGEGADKNPYFPQVDNDAACCICNDTEDSNVNQIIFCDMCNIPVHQECYGVPYIPEGQWLCRRCQLSPSVPVNCALCPYAFGAFKQTSCGQWAHVICALWLNEVHFANVVFNEPIEGISYALKRRAKLRCIVCRQKYGACLQCSARVCRASFHVTCGFFAGFYTEVKSESSRNSGGVNRYAYCPKHYPDSKKPKITEKAWKRMINRQILQAKAQVLSTSRDAPQISVPVIPREKIDKIRVDLNLEKIEDICYYWALKRRSRFGVPLIRRLQVYQTQKTLRHLVETKADGEQPVCESSDTSNSRIRAVRRKRKSTVCSPSRRETYIVSSPYTSQVQSPVNGMDSNATPSVMVRSLGMGGGTIVGNVDTPEQVYIMRLRANLERLRLLCELVKKREKIKRDFVTVTEAMLDHCAKMSSGATMDSFVSRGEYLSGKQGSMELKTMLKYLNNLALIKESDLNEKSIPAVKSEPSTKERELNSSTTVPSNFITPTPKRRGPVPGKKAINSLKREAKATTDDKTAANDKVTDTKKRKTRIDDFFALSAAEMTPSTSFAAPVSPTTRSAASNAYRTKCAEDSDTRPLHSRSYLRSGALLSDVSADDLTATSMDDDDDIEFADPVLPNVNTSRRGGSSIRGRRGGKRDSHILLSHPPSPTTRLKAMPPTDTPVLLNGNSNEFEGGGTKRKRRTLPGRLKFNEFDSSDPNVFAHNDIVWVRMNDSENSLQMPARVVDLRMRAFLDDSFPIDKALQAKPPAVDGQSHVLVVLFDTAKTWKWIPTYRLSPCDFSTSSKNIPSQARSPCDSALKRARQFWNDMLHE